LVFIVDMVNGFCREGSLHDTSILEISKEIKKLLKHCDHHIFVCDSHDLNAREFGSYPIHCVAQTAETEVIKELRPFVNTILYKNSTNTFVAKSFQDQLSMIQENYQDIIIVGCCSDICILQFALSLNTYFNEINAQDKRVIVPINMCETYHIDRLHDQEKMNEIACDMMLTNGIKVVKLGGHDGKL
ncbi:MAG: cysteine hydrolase family protein, partial [Breznakia sp.]